MIMFNSYLKRSLTVALLTFAVLVGVASSALALTCAELPAPAFQSNRYVQFDIGVLPDLPLRRVPAPKDLYYRAVCGALPGVITGLVANGEGAVIAIPPLLAAELDRATPAFPTANFMYVRGGGLDRPAIVILFTDDINSPFFSEVPAEQGRSKWDATEVGYAERFWNSLPYEFMVRASYWLHDAVDVGSGYQIGQNLPVVGWLLNTLGRLFSDRFSTTMIYALANPLGSMLIPTVTDTGQRRADIQQDSIWVHELAHYNHFFLEGTTPLLWAGDFGRISRRNAYLGPIPIPFMMVERYAEARDYDCGSGATPYGYVSNYARCGEWRIMEDFSDTLSVAVQSTQLLRSDQSFYYDLSKLYGRNNNADGQILYAKAQHLKQAFSYSLADPMDADGDGVPWQLGLPSYDCDDINPTRVQTCSSQSCTQNADCDDGDPCTVDTCAADGTCLAVTRDTDGDGSADSACGGGDCDDNDPNIREGTSRTCSTPCGAGTEVCSAGTFSQCTAPSTCDCNPGEQRQEQCGDRCGVATRTCKPDGTWGPLGACQSQGQCTPGDFDSRTCPSLSGCSQPTGTQSRTCQADCTWPNFGACTGGAVCCPGTNDTQPCGLCGTGERARTCQSDGSWGAFSSCSINSECCPGDVDSDRCGECGSRRRTCQADGTWGSFSSCDEPECCWPETQTRDCSECGTQTRRCRSRNRWGSWGSCSGSSTECSPGEFCSSSGQCVCTPATSCPPSIVCGSISDGCGGTIDCGGCPSGEYCSTATNTCQSYGTCSCFNGSVTSDSCRNNSSASCSNPYECDCVSNN